MKKIVLLAVLALALAACSAPMYMSASDIALRAKMGMTVDEFERLTNHQAQMFDRTLHGISFSVEDFNTVGQVSGYKLFHFNSEGRLYRIETRRLQPVYRAAPAAPPVQQYQQRSMWD